MAKLLTGSINLSKINKEKLFTSEKGDKFLNVSVWINDKKDNYGNDAAIQQYMGKDAEKNYIGNLKFFEKKETTNEKPGNLEEPDDLPF